MFTRKSVLCLFVVLLAVLASSGIASARPLAALLGTGFTYQGRLTDGGAPASGTYDFEFKLYDDLSAGSQVGSTVTQGDVTVTGGLFTVQLDFGDVFDGTALYLDVGVRPGAETGAYTALTPRQQLTATPYAIFAAKAPWSGLTGMPAGFADGLDNGSSYQNVKVVAKSGGDFTTITDALNSITDAGDTNRYLVYVAPGVYSEQVTMKSYVDIEGAGELTTKITFTGSSNVYQPIGTVTGAHNAELRFLTVENTGGDLCAAAIFNSNASPRLIHVTARALGGTSLNIGVYNRFSSPTMTDVTASAFSAGGGFNAGVWNIQFSSPTMMNVAASASEGNSNYGVYNDQNSTPTMINVTARASNGSHNYGVANMAGSSPTMTNVVASATNGAGLRYGVYNRSSSPTINNSVITASGGASNYGIVNEAAGGAYTVQVNNSQIFASTNTIRSDVGYTIGIAASQLNGGPISGGGTVICAGVYDEGYAFFASTCP